MTNSNCKLFLGLGLASYKEAADDSNRTNSSLWKRVIAWERSRAASGYGIIWGEADRNKQEGFSAECQSVDWFNRTTDSNKIEVIVLDDQKSRELRRIRTTGLAVSLDDCTIL